jgi:hypothetical protein
MPIPRKGHDDDKMCLLGPKGDRVVVLLYLASR